MNDSEQKRIFAKNLNNLIEKNQLTQSEVASKIGVSPQTFNTWCRGIALPRMGKIQRLSDFFNVDITELIDDISDKQEPSYYINPETSHIAQEIYDNKELKLLFDAARTASPQDLKATHDILLALKRREVGNPDE